eukprot:1796721-Ditylum_brightwellii.AAC.1
MAVKYMLRCLGMKVTKLYLILGDNQSVIVNLIAPSSLLKKNHISASYHMVCGATATKIM